MRAFITRDPYEAEEVNMAFHETGAWPCWWIGCGDAIEKPFVTAYRKHFSLERGTPMRIHVSADERYELFIDGERIGRGPERGDPAHWFYETFNLTFGPGEHIIVAKVMSLGFAAPRAQMSVHPGFLLSPQEKEHVALIGTGVAQWEVKQMAGYSFGPPFPHDFFSIGYNTIIDGSAYPWGFEKGAGDGWKPAVRLHAGANAKRRNRYPAIHLLNPATSPVLLDCLFRGGTARFVSALEDCDPAPVAIDPDRHDPVEAGEWDALLLGNGRVTLPARASRRVIIDLGNYFCAYSGIRVSGGRGASVRLHWAESLFCDAAFKAKGNRDEITHKYFSGVGDTFRCDGGESRSFESLLWRAGCYLELVIHVAEEPLVIEELLIRETRAPFEQECVFTADDPRLAGLIPAALRTLQMSAHDSFTDGPYYEQMTWAGDGVQTTLVSYVMQHDDRLARKMLSLFEGSRLLNGLTRARWPARDTATIAPYSLYWVQMVRDFAFWRDDPAFVKSLMPGVRAVVDAFLGFLNGDQLIVASQGWNFVDWVPGWAWGVPPGADGGANATINWQFVAMLGMVARLEEITGEPELAARAWRLAAEHAARLTGAFWNEERRLFADDLAHGHFSEHGQVFAILGGQLDPQQCDRIALLEDPSLTRTTISFSHHLFEAYRALGRTDAMFPRLEYWHGLGRLGLKTLPEGPEPSRSDCHAWSAHPVYHYFASILGIRPASPGFKTVRIAPQPGPLKHLSGRMPHPRGEIVVEIDIGSDSHVKAQIVLPPGITGTFEFAGTTIPLHEGARQLEISPGLFYNA